MTYTGKQADELRGFLKQVKSVAEIERGLALLTLAKGKKRSEVAEIFEIHVDTLDSWQTQFKRLGVAGIANKGYPGNHYKLTRGQKEEIKKTIKEQDPKKLRLSEKRFWTVKLLKQFIKEQYGVVYASEATYRKLYYAFGFSCHKPGRHNRNQRPADVARFRVAVKKKSENTRGWAVWYW